MGAGNAEIKGLLAGLKIMEVPQQYLQMKINGKTITFNVQFRDIANASDNSTTLVSYTPDKNGNVNVVFQVSLNAAGAKTPDSKGMEEAKGMHLFHEMHHLIIETMDIASGNGAIRLASPTYKDFKNEEAQSKQAAAESGKLANTLGVMLRLKDGTMGNVAVNKRVDELLDFLVKERFASSRTQNAFHEPGGNNLIAGKYADNFINHRLHTGNIAAAAR